MRTEASTDHELVRATVRRLLIETCPTTFVRDVLDDPRGATDEVWAGLAGMGLHGLLVPTEFGGHAAGYAAMGPVLEELGRALYPGPFLSSAVAAVNAILLIGTPDDQARLLPGLACGDTVASLALLEPSSRYDWSGPATTASPSNGGWRLDGEKIFVPDGARSDVLLVSATVADGRGVFEVKGSDCEVTPLVIVDGTRKQARVVLRGVPAMRLGGGDATDVLGRVVDRAVLGLLFDGVGAAEAALELATAYAKVRVQFDRPIGSFQAVQHLLADMLRNVELARSGAHAAAQAADAGDDDECHRLATMAMAFAGDALYRVGADAIQVFGGVGFTWDNDIHLYYRRLMSMGQVFGGTPEFRDEYARLLLGS